MLKETNLDGVKSVARMLLMIPIRETPYSPAVVQHPFTSCGIASLNKDGKFQLLDIMAKEYVLKMELKGSNLWREIAVSGGMNFSDLHDIIQTIFGWGNKHLHRFMVGRLEIGDYEDEDDMPINFKYEGDANIDLIFLNKKTIQYEYDYGDGWQIEITVLEVKEIKKFAPPCVLKSEGGMAKDDCGGVDGLKEIEKIPVNIEELNLILAHTYE